MLTTADGRRYWPVFGTRALMDAAPLAQYQFVQKTHDLVEVRVVANPPLTAAQEAVFCARVLSMLPPGMSLRVVHCESIARGASGKYEEFLSELSAAPR